jgi:HAD superfamily hydrolase (TIGR01509 family)
MMACDAFHEPAAVLWDLDGTLADSTAFHWMAWRDTMLRESEQIAYQQFVDSFGKKNDAILREWFGDDITPEQIQRLSETKETMYRDLVARNGLEPLPGARDWVVRLAADGWRQAIASSAPRANVEVAIRALDFGGCIQAWATAEDVGAGKPDPGIFLVAAARLTTASGRCIVVEDAAAGIEAARRAGMRSIGVNPAGDLPADIASRSLTDLPADTFRRLLCS